MAKFKGTDGTDTIVGTDGDDTIVPLLGEDDADGGAGYDTLVVNYSSLTDAFFSSNISRRADGSWAGVMSGGPQFGLSYVGFRNIEEMRFTATQGNDYLDVDLGTPTPDKSLLRLDGAGGDDILAVSGAELTERLTLKVADDGTVKSNFATLAGWDYYHIILGLSAGNKLVLGAGDDTVSSTGGRDTIDGGLGDDLWIGYYQDRIASLDTVINAANATFSVHDDGGRLADVRNVESIVLQSGAGDDLVTAYGGAGLVDGGSGSDTLSLNSSTPDAPTQYEVYVANGSYLAGMATELGGSDTLNFSEYEQIVLGGGSGGDRFDFTSGQYLLPNDYHVSFLGGEGDDTLGLILFAQDPVAIRGDAAGAGHVDGLGSSNSVGWTGIETLTATLGTGDDRIDYNVASKSLVVDGGAGADTIDFGAATVGVSFRLNLTAAQLVEGISIAVTNVENAVGSIADDKLGGDGLANRLSGGYGADTLTGRGGADLFAYAMTQDSNASGGHDKITDFSHAQGDKIDLQAIDANSATTPANDAFAWIGDAAFHGVAGELREVAARGGWFLYGDTDGDKTADLTIFVAGGTAVSPEDVVL